MTSIRTLVASYATPFLMHLIVSSIVLAIAIAASYLPRLSARTRFAVLAIGVAKFLVPASLFAPLIPRSNIVAAVLPVAIPRAIPIAMPIPSEPATTPLDWILLFIATACLVLAAVTVIGSFSTVAAALRSAMPAASREIALLNAARKRIGVAYAIDLVRSPISEAPAVLGVLRPLIILPADGPDALEDDELESLLCHECAHVARRDNLLAVIVGVVRALFWFNPLVWLAHRRLAEEREKACDEIVADNGQRAETYAQALVKVCNAILARPAAGVSCMASAHLKQRMEHIMRYDKSARSAFSHFAMTSAAIILLFAAAAATAAINGARANNSTDPYFVTAKVGKIGADLYAVRIAVNEKSTNRLAWASRALRVKVGETFNARGGASVGSEPDVDFRTEGSVNANGDLTVTVDIRSAGALVQSSTVTAAPTEADRYTGAPISMSLKGADIHDVLKTFASITGLEIVASDEVAGKVDVNLTNVPWDEALDRVLKEHGYAWRLEGNKLSVFKQ